jgi:hypothetical protein
MATISEMRQTTGNARFVMSTAIFQDSFSLVGQYDNFKKNRAISYCDDIDIEGSTSYTSEFRINEIDLLLREIPGLRFKLLLPIKVTIQPRENFYFIQNDDLDISEGGVSFEEALNNFYEFFRNDLEHWLEQSDDDLTKDARDLKVKFLEYVDTQ